jgi:hypothetical protein
MGRDDGRPRPLDSEGPVLGLTAEMGVRMKGAFASREKSTLEKHLESSDASIVGLLVCHILFTRKQREILLTGDQECQPPCTQSRFIALNAESEDSSCSKRLNTF